MTACITFVLVLFSLPLWTKPFFSMLSLFRSLSLLCIFSHVFSTVCLSLESVSFHVANSSDRWAHLIFPEILCPVACFYYFLHLMSPFLCSTNKQHDFILYRHIFCLFDCLSYSASHSLILFLWRFVQWLMCYFGIFILSLHIRSSFVLANSNTSKFRKLEIYSFKRFVGKTIDLLK